MRLTICEIVGLEAGRVVCGLRLQSKAALKRTHSKRSAFAMQRAEINVGRAIELT